MRGEWLVKQVNVSGAGDGGGIEGQKRGRENIVGDGGGVREHNW